jgi:hypothetical protein
VYIYQILVLLFELSTGVIAKTPVGAKAHNPARQKEWTTHFTLSGGPSWHLTRLNTSGSSRLRIGQNVQDRLRYQEMLSTG